MNKPVSPERAVADDRSLSLLQKILLVTDGTVTQLLEVITGDRIRVEKLEHAMVQGGPEILAVSATEPVLSRAILLCGENGRYMHAHSWLVPQRMPEGMQDAMRDTDTPIGQLWKTARLETYREILDFRREQDPEVSALLGREGDLLARRYLIHAGGRPMGLIVEKFPAALFA